MRKVKTKEVCLEPSGECLEFVLFGHGIHTQKYLYFQFKRNMAAIGNYYESPVNRDCHMSPLDYVLNSRVFKFLDTNCQLDMPNCQPI